MIKYCILFSCVCHYLLITVFSNYNNYYSNNDIKTNKQNNINVSLVNVKNIVNKNEIPKLELQKEIQKNIQNKSKKIVSKKLTNNNQKDKNIQQIKKDNWQTQIRKHFNKLKKQHLFYPLIAIQNNIQGVVEVKIFLDNNGNVIISRIENSSGYEILDNAALQAVKSIRSLEENAPREFILPVRFSLN